MASSMAAAQAAADPDCADWNAQQAVCSAAHLCVHLARADQASQAGDALAQHVSRHAHDAGAGRPASCQPPHQAKKRQCLWQQAGGDAFSASMAAS